MTAARAPVAVSAPLVSVVVPVLNDAGALAALLETLQNRPGLELIVADGGSTDDSVAVAQHRSARVVCCRAGRGHQLACGIAAAQAPWLWLLHADSEPAPSALQHLLGRPADEPAWGRFNVSLSDGIALKTIAYMINLRSCLTGVCTGDQGLFVHRRLLDAVGGMPEQSLMEDIELTRRLRRLQRPDCRSEHIATSPRRWLENGVVSTVLSMWRLRLWYWLGADPEQLAREYYQR